MATKGIKGAQIRANGSVHSRVASGGIVGVVKQISNLKGGNNLVGHGVKSAFHSFSKPSTHSAISNKIVQAKGAHLA